MGFEETVKAGGDEGDEGSVRVIELGLEASAMFLDLSHQNGRLVKFRP